MALDFQKLNAWAGSLRPFFPEFIRSKARKLHQTIVLHDALEQLQEGRLNPKLIEKLVYGWGKWGGWAADADFLSAVGTAAEQNSGPILECGAGVSTLLLGVLAQKMGFDVWTLEHDLRWGDLVSEHLKRLKIDKVKVCVAALKNYDKFQWYDPPLIHMPRHFSLVICDGPPGNTRGGRYGLLPIMADRLAPQSRIFLHDFGREEERSAVKKWQEEFDIVVTKCGGEEVYASIEFNGKKRE